MRGVDIGGRRKPSVKYHYFHSFFTYSVIRGKDFGPCVLVLSKHIVFVTRSEDNVRRGV